MDMDFSLNGWRRYLAERPIQFHEDCVQPVLNALYEMYSETHIMSNDKTRQLDGTLNDALGRLTYRQKDAVFSTVNSLCAEHEQIAFLAGLQLGAQLMLELTEEVNP